MEWAELTPIGRASLAALLGFVIGIEREWRGKSAGERTFALLAFAAAGATSVGELLGPDGASRVIQGVLTGVGFIGAGLIFRRTPEDIRGLTTAAGSWAATAIGILAGVGAYAAAALGTVTILLIFQLDRIPFIGRIRTEASDSSKSSGSSDSDHSADED